MSRDTTPEGLRLGGLHLWVAITEAHELDEAQRVQLVEACRAKDRLDIMDAMLRGDDSVWGHVEFSIGKPSVLVLNSALDKANATANLMKQLLASLRLPDVKTGKRPQAHGNRGVSVPSGGAMNALERAMSRKSA